ncbi:peptide-methionine (S)-S-oxide reductase MsrA [Pseudoalteromonas xiamenensis]|uniref:peptide-methionine (S)-S-oxide reductase MsrA n=1 Tax=Pseudoalteromonas xiamenensis TaxID=882626 RepID=UPI0027E511D5|nr:peptide-methionine (S)-S-oxide reductase MsrA [Pseudoalteromonas xiamenensis]WMN58373.1 peptide-methionine (S)-S-oxide reductase MsrA [Pseudoalteromonas xiamenensis]
MQVATFGGGCFWCIDAAFRRVNGVSHVESGYMGGHIDNPTYRAVCSGLTGHAEVVQITFDERVVSFETLLEMLFVLHDPTQLNRQGNDVGTQYRSVVFYHTNEQKSQTQQFIERVVPHFSELIVTEVSEASVFYSAETYHQDYYNLNPEQGYCSVLIAPKLAKFSQHFAELLND